MSHQKLEQYKWFPIVAWTLSISFALYVGHLALELRTTAEKLQSSSLSLEYRIDEVERMLRGEKNGTTTTPD